jgi:hypothetical protein
MSNSSRKRKVTSTRGVNLKKTNFERVPSNRYLEIELTARDIKELLGGRVSGRAILEKKKINYPLYLYGFINQAHSVRRATHPSRVGKVHTLFKQRKFRSLNEWKKWYTKKYPKAIQEAIAVIHDTFKKGIGPIKKSHRKYVKLFVENLIFEQTYTGLSLQEAIFTKMARITKKKYRPSTAKEDSRGIDGFIGEIPVSIKPTSSPVKKTAGVKRVYYKIDEEKHTLSFTFSI